MSRSSLSLATKCEVACHPVMYIKGNGYGLSLDGTTYTPGQ